MRLLSTLLLTFLPACAGAPAGGPETPGRRDPVSVLEVPPVEEAHEWLTLQLQPTRPVAMVWRNILEEGVLGRTLGYEDRYEIILDPRLSGWEGHMVLIHEWAHVLVREEGLEPMSQHGEEWGRLYSKVFRAWVGDTDS